ncbi:MAG TPA: long-chain fatty acid--CoA ligase [Gemmatimonadales bacterium]|nr:long-chain fatty acid--CoA ligase [Gemmatimonadales bacterium]
MTVPAPGTLTKLFFDAIEKYGHKPAALRYKAGGTWHDISHQELLARVRRFALALRRMGVQRGDRVAILAENRPEWAIADYACLCIGVTDVPIYPTLPPNQIRYILNDSGAVAVCVSTAPQLAKILEIRDSLPGLRHVIAFDADATGPRVTALAEVYRMGEEAEAAGEGARFKEEALTVRPDDLATIIYTSGTTGDPKGVMLTHNNIYANCVNAMPQLPVGEEDSTLSFLPLSHIFERMAGHYAIFSFGATINYAESIDTLVVNLGEVKPTIVMAVPRVYEKVYARALENALASPIRKRIFFWAKHTGERWADYMLAGRQPPRGLAIKYGIAKKLVFSKLAARVGGRLRFFISGGAPLPADIAKFFYAAGLPIYEGYGLTETSPVIAVNTPDRYRLGTVGQVIPNLEVKIAPDGEILVRGPSVMKGYYNKPEATAEAIDAEGWFHTGDIGVFEDGFLKITDRKKDIIVTAAGKNIAPQPIEAMAKKSKYVANAVMLGDRRKFPVMLIVPQYEHLEPWAKRKNLAFKDRRELIGLPEVKAKMEREVMRALEGLAKFEVPKKIMLLEQDFTIESGDLTPTLKVKRRVVEKKFQREIDAMYEAAEKETAAV